jgi:cytochrome c553
MVEPAPRAIEPKVPGVRRTPHSQGCHQNTFFQQFKDFKSGARNSSGPRRGTVAAMIIAAKALTDGEARAAAEYFSKLSPQPNIKVIEADTVPRTYVAAMDWAAVANGGSEPIGKRIVELPVDIEQFERRDTRAMFVAYVPLGSIARGRALALEGPSKAANGCSSCHGADLRGVVARFLALRDVPPPTLSGSCTTSSRERVPVRHPTPCRRWGRN